MIAGNGPEQKSFVVAMVKGADIPGFARMHSDVLAF
jgi:hypothetical protein